MSVFVEINDPGDRVNVHFRYDVVIKDKVKAIPGARFLPAEKGGPIWQLPLDLTAMRQLREEFGDELQIGAALKAWGQVAVRNERKLISMSVSDDYPIEEMKLHRKLPKLAEWFRPYQRADVKFKATTSCMNLLEPRLGKTAETIGAIYETGIEHGAHLVIAPQKTLDSVWRMEWERWTDLPVITLSGETKENDRIMDHVHMERWYQSEEPFVLCTTADMIRRGLPDGFDTAVEWNSMTIDEFHKTGLPEIKNVFPKKAGALKLADGGRRYALSGTPMGGKPIKLWGALHWLFPDDFTSKWKWAGQWLEIESGYRDHKIIKGVKAGKEEAFWEMLAQYSIRRLRTEVLPQLPEKQWIDVWCDMTEKQNKQYRTFHADAEVRIDEHHISAVGVLAEYTRLKQFADARQEVEVLGMDEETGRLDLKLKPTFDSGKLPHLLERLAEQGIDPKEPEGQSQAIVTSQFREVTEMAYNYLTAQGIECIKITGKVSKAESERAQRAFKAGADNEGLRVCCMVTTMGVGLTLDNVETVHVLDETWVPDDQDQVTDRAVNTSRMHQVSVFVYRSRNTIEQYVMEVNDFKASLNSSILDLRRRAKKGIK